MSSHPITSVNTLVPAIGVGYGEKTCNEIRQGENERKMKKKEERGMETYFWTMIRLVQGGLGIWRMYRDDEPDKNPDAVD